MSREEHCAAAGPLLGGAGGEAPRREQSRVDLGSAGPGAAAGFRRRGPDRVGSGPANRNGRYENYAIWMVLARSDAPGIVGSQNAKPRYVSTATGGNT